MPVARLDLPHLAQQHIEHDAVDRVVGAVEQARLHLRRLLAEAVDAALALFQAVRVPGQVVVQDGGEVFLQVDALAEAVGGDQDARLVARHLLDALLAEVVGVFAGDDLEVELGELLASAPGRAARPRSWRSRCSGRRRPD